MKCEVEYKIEYSWIIGASRPWSFVDPLPRRHILSPWAPREMRWLAGRCLLNRMQIGSVWWIRGWLNSPVSMIVFLFYWLVSFVYLISKGKKKTRKSRIVYIFAPRFNTFRLILLLSQHFTYKNSPLLFSFPQYNVLIILLMLAMKNDILNRYYKLWILS